MRFKYQVMDWIDEHAVVRIPLRMFCIAAVVSLAVRCMPEPANGQCVPGDNNGDGAFSFSDVVYAINYIFGGGAAPVACPCPESFFLFDGEFPTAVETYYDDSNWIWSQFGALQLRQEHGVRMVYRINGPDSSRSIYWLVPDSAREMLNAAVAETVDAIDSMDFAALVIPRLAAAKDTVDLDTHTYWSDDWESEWVEGNITYREYLDLRLRRIDHVTGHRGNDLEGSVRVRVYSGDK